MTISLSEDVVSDINNPGVAGVYKADGTYLSGMPVLRHEEGEFTLIKNGGWKVTYGVHGFSDYLHSGSAPSLCPADPRATRNESRRLKLWRYTPKFKLFGHTGYPESSGIIIKCAKHKYLTIKGCMSVDPPR